MAGRSGRGRDCPCASGELTGEIEVVRVSQPPESKTAKHSSGLQITERTHAKPSGDVLVPHYCTLEGFAQEASDSSGVEIALLSPLTRLQVQTQNTLYRLTLIDTRESVVLIEGGRFFTERSEVHLCGSSYGGTLIKISWIGVGMRMELLSHGRRIVTSPVVFVETLDDDDLPGPF